MVTSRSVEGIQRKLVYNESIILVDATDSVLFEIKSNEYSLHYNIRFNFRGDGKKFTSSGVFDKSSLILNVDLFQWDGAQYVENIEPMTSQLPDGRRIWIKYRTMSEPETKFRRFEISVWGEVK